MMRIGRGSERWMVLLPIAALGVLITLYIGGPEQTLDSLERLAHDGWEHVALMMRR